jgi:ATP-binding cassette subfamily B protein
MTTERNPRGTTRWALSVGRGLARTAVWALMFTLLGTTARLIGPLVIRAGIDHGISAGDRGLITRSALALAAVLVIQYGAQRTAQYGVSLLGERYLRALRVTVFEHLMRLDMAFYARSKSGVLVSRMTHDMEAVQEFTEEGAVTIVINTLTVTGVAAAMFLVDATTTLQIPIVMAAVLLASWIFQRIAGRAYREVREQIGRVLGSLQEGISGVRVVQAFTREREQAGSFGRVNQAYLDAQMKTARAVSWYFPTINFFRVVGYAIVLVSGGGRVVSGDLSFGTLVTLLIYIDWFFQPIIGLSITWNQMQSAGAALGKLRRLLEVAPAVRDAPGAQSFAGKPTGEIRLEGVSFEYQPGVRVVQDVDLVVAPGERVAAVGETGAGKSTVARLVLRFYDPVEGVVKLDGKDLRQVTLESKAQHIVLIPQEGFLFNGSLRENLRYARPDATDEEIWTVCRALGIEDWVRSLPERLDTPVRERGGRFSAGERQLVALARALLIDPSVIVLDEATANLDPETEARVEQALATLLAGRTAIVIAHRLRSAERADRVVMMDRGRIVAEGAHDDLVRTSPDYARLVSVWERGVLR